MHLRKPARLVLGMVVLAILLAGQAGPVRIGQATPEAELVINEFVALNRNGPVDEDGEHSDWIELYNRSSQPISLAGWALTDDPQRPDRWPLPALTLNGGEYLLVWASGKNRRPETAGAEYHANFKLAGDGEFLGLYHHQSGRYGDLMTRENGNGYPAQRPDLAYGRAADGRFAYFAHPTPGGPNDEGSRLAGLVGPVAVSLPRGLYHEPHQLTLTTTTPAAVIRYTRDGSRPTVDHGQVYTGPLTIATTTLLRAAAFRPGYAPAAVTTHSYLFMADILHQPADPPGFPATWGGYQGKPVQADYEMDPAVVNDPRYRDQFAAALTVLPSLSLVTEMPSFHDLYTNPRRRGRAWERPVSVEWIDPSGAEPGFQIDAGLRIQGDTGRLEMIPKHAFRLFFRSEYGAPRLDYPLFPDSPVQSFDTLVLRSGMNRSYAGWPGSDQTMTTYTRDEWLRASQIAISGSGVHGRFVHLYLNGLYWGLYNLVERPDAAFMASYFGGREEDWQTISHAETLAPNSPRFETLHQLAAAGNLADPARYELLGRYLDIPHFIDYLILNWYSGNLDWAFNNWYATTPRSDGPIKYYVWDGERIWYDGAEIFMAKESYNGWPNLVDPLFQALLENPDFRLALADRLAAHLLDGGPLSDARAQARWREINRTVETAIIAESARWGDTRRAEPITQADWLAARDDVLGQMQGNSARLLALAREVGYYPPLDPPRFGDRGAPLPATLYYTTDGSDPRQAVSGTVAPAARVYQAPFTVASPTLVKARLFDGTDWSPLSQARFEASEQVTIGGR